MLQGLSWSPFGCTKIEGKYGHSKNFLVVEHLTGLTGAPAQLAAADRGDSSILTMFGLGCCECSPNAVQMLWRVDYVQN